MSVLGSLQATPLKAIIQNSNLESNNKSSNKLIINQYIIVEMDSIAPHTSPKYHP